MCDDVSILQPYHAITWPTGKFYIFIFREFSRFKKLVENTGQKFGQKPKTSDASMESSRSRILNQQEVFNPKPPHNAVEIFMRELSVIEITDVNGGSAAQGDGDSDGGGE